METEAYLLTLVGDHAPVMVRIEIRTFRQILERSHNEVIDVREILAALPRLIQRYREMVADLGNIARTNPDRARECVRSILGQIRVKPDNGVLVAEIALNETPLAALAGGVPMEMVAGARFGNYLPPSPASSADNARK